LVTDKRSAGIIEFWNIDNLDLIGKGEHFMSTDFQWDPTGRYFSTSVSQYRHQSENGYIIWNFLGQIQTRLKIEKFWQFLWRPRPSTLLSIKEEDEIRRNLNEKKNDFIKESKLIKEKLKITQLEKRKVIYDEFFEIISSLKKEYDDEKELRIKICDGIDIDDIVYEIVEESVEELIESKEELVN